VELEDTYYVDSPPLRSFIDEVKTAIAEEEDAAQRVQRLRPAFSRLLRDQAWLPDEYLRPDPTGGMGGGIGNYLLYRSGDRALTLMSLVLPGGSNTPVHDHLAWGLVGVYAGEQHEWVYRRLDDDGDEGAAEITEVEQRHLRPGDFYDLLPPEGDIHAVSAMGDSPSVSLHLLGNDIGCVLRHRYEPEEGRVHPFRSSYSNAPCSDETRQ
jgi:predicted metal-dependent enzyme (double-stranded beta helix superfamily)